MLHATTHVTDSNSVIHQDGALVHIAFKTVQLLQCKKQTPFYLTYNPVMVHRLTSLATRLRESYSSISMNCE